MGDSTKPQQKYAGTGENCNIVIAVIFTLYNLSEILYAYYLDL